MSPEAGHLPAMLLFIALSICTIFLIKMGRKKKISMASQPSQLKKKGPPAVAGHTCPRSLGGGSGASCPVGTVLPPQDDSAGTLIRGLWSLGLFLFHEE